jgi:putative tricarboxylic transport membrane protein
MSERAGVPESVGVRRRTVRAPKNFAAGLSLIALALIAFWETADLGQGSFYAIGPALLPRMVATLLGGIGAALTAGSLLMEGDALGRWSLRGPLFIFLGVLAFALSIRTVGLALAGPLVALIGGAASPETRTKELIVFAIVVTALSIGLFRYLLHLPIPILIIPNILVL